MKTVNYSFKSLKASILQIHMSWVVKLASLLDSYIRVVYRNSELLKRISCNFFFSQFFFSSLEDVLCSVYFSFTSSPSFFIWLPLLLFLPLNLPLLPCLFFLPLILLDARWYLCLNSSALGCFKTFYKIYCRIVLITINLN